MNVQEAGDAARYFHTGSSAPTGQVMTDGGIVQLEGGVCNAVRTELEQRGHHLMRAPNSGGYQVWRQGQKGLLKAPSQCRVRF
jgi:gamma-glutamyltranspeptidase/glutathione hydrolase